MSATISAPAAIDQTHTEIARGAGIIGYAVKRLGEQNRAHLWRDANAALRLAVSGNDAMGTTAQPEANLANSPD